MIVSPAIEVLRTTPARQRTPAQQSAGNGQPDVFPGVLAKAALTRQAAIPHPVRLVKRGRQRPKGTTVLRMQGIEVRGQLLVALPWHAYAVSSINTANGKPSTRVENGPPLG